MSENVAKRASVLLSFSGENVRSFRDEFHFSMLATTMARPDTVRQVAWREGGNPVGVLPVAGIFGANAAGKTNALRAMADMREFVLGSFRASSPSGGVPIQPFRLDPDFEERPTSLEIDVVLDGVRHEYGFVTTRARVLEEWAFHYPRGRSTLLFRRDEDNVEIGKGAKAKGRAVQELLRPNALFLSTAASANHPLLLPIYEWFERNLLLAQADSRASRQAFTASYLDDESRRPQVLALLKAADHGITGARLDAAMKERFQKAIGVLTGEDLDAGDADIVLDDDVRLTHRGAAGDVELHALDESLGTRVWFGLVGLVVDALNRGAVLLADELDSSFHPALVEQLIRLFQDPETNPHRAQLIFNSHDVTVLGDAREVQLLGRDQIWFTEKRDDGSTRLYSLTSMGPRKDEAISRRYLAGRYGGLPLLSPAEFDQAADLITSGDSG